MAKPKGKASRKKPATHSSGKKRVASAAFPAENNRDEFFEGSDSEAPSHGEEDEQQVETAPEKRNRIGMYELAIPWLGLPCFLWVMFNVLCCCSQGVHAKGKYWAPRTSWQ